MGAVVIVVLTFLMTVVLADEAGVTRWLWPLQLSATIVGGGLAWLSSRRESWNVASRHGTWVATAGAGVFVLLIKVAQARGDFYFALAGFTGGVAMLVLFLHQANVEAGDDDPEDS
ncbi:hypothetical protein CCO04_04170 [Pimelobacter sp. 30-1]|nr:hypothetical protein [Pimelobacter sp. 30-1]